MTSTLERGLGAAGRLGLRARLHLGQRAAHRRSVRFMAAHGVTLVVDVGANTGQYGHSLRRAGFGGRIISAEPLSREFRRLDERAGRDGRWSAVHAALGARPGRVPLHVAGNSVSSSLLEMLDSHAGAAPASAYVRTEVAEVRTVDDLLDSSGVGPAERVFLKIDTQGYEAPVLDGAQRWLPRLAGVQVELSLLPLYAGQALMGDLLRRLTDAGLELWSLEPVFVDPRTGRLLQVDGVFFRARPPREAE
jgi:FkbM family methyltransferase